MTADPSASPDPSDAPLGSGIDFSDPNSPLAPYYLRVGQVLAVAAVAVTFVFFNFLPLWYTDIWMHMKFGQWIVEHRELPTHEPFTAYTDKEAPLTHYAWLSQVGFYLTYAAGERLAGGDDLHRLAGGVEALRFVQGLLASLYCTFFLLAYRRASDSWPLACLGLVPLLGFSPTLLGFLRPQVIGAVLFALTMAALSRKELSRRAMIGLPLAFAVWANCHGSFLIGLYLIGLFLAGRVVEVCMEQRTWNPLAAWNDGQVRKLAITLALAVLASLVNPHGPRLWVEAVLLARHPNIPTLDEWKPLTFTMGPGGHWGWGATMVLLAVSFIASRRWPTPTQALLILGFGLFPLLQQRWLIWWVGLVPWLVMPHWKAFVDRLDWEWVHRQSVPSFHKTVIAGLIVLLAFGASGTGQWLLHHEPRPHQFSVSHATPWRVSAQLQEAPSNGSLPVLAQALREHYPDGRFRGSIFASEGVGEYLIWSLPPDVPVLAYTHVHLITPEHWQECLKVKYGRPGWKEFLNAHRVNLVVVQSEGHPFLHDRIKRDPDWIILVDETGKSSVREPTQRMLIALRRNPL